MDTSGVGGIAGLKYAGYAGVVFVFEYLKIPAAQVMILTVLMIVDFAAGMSKQIILNPRGLTSHRAWVGLMKKIWTLMSVFIIALVMSGVASQWSFDFYLTGFIALLIAAEGYSILQNIYVIRTGKEVPEYDVISKIIKWVGNMFVEFIERTTGADKYKNDNEFK